MKKPIFCVLFFMLFFVSFAQKRINLIEKKSGNHLLELAVSTKIDGNTLVVTIGNDNSINMQGKDIMLWLFYEHFSLKELEKADNKITISSTIGDELSRDGFLPVKSDNLILKTKTGYDKITRKLELVFEIKEPNAPSRVKLFLYPSEITGNKKKNARFFTLFEPYTIHIDAMAKNSRKGSRTITIESDEYTSPEQRELIAFENFKKNLSVYVEDAKEIFKNASEDHSQGNDISAYVLEMQGMKDDIDFDKDDFKAQIRDDESLRMNLKQFESIYRELTALSGRPAVVQGKVDENNAGEEKETNPLKYILLGVGGMLLSGLLVMVVQNILQSIKDKKKEKKLAEEQKKQLAEQERILKEAQQAAQPKVRKRI